MLFRCNFDVIYFVTRYREKLKKKLEESGGLTFQIPMVPQIDALYGPRRVDIEMERRARQVLYRDMMSLYSNIV